eukprot:490741-Alexandrium_andersonii.AAC.1
MRPSPSHAKLAVLPGHTEHVEAFHASGALEHRPDRSWPSRKFCHPQGAGAHGALSGAEMPAGPS